MRRARAGSSQSRKSHSRLTFRKILGALGVCPEMKSKAPPTPMATLTPVSRSRFLSDPVILLGATVGHRQDAAPDSLIISIVRVSVALPGSLQLTPLSPDPLSVHGVSWRSIGYAWLPAQQEEGRFRGRRRACLSRGGRFR